MSSAGPQITHDLTGIDPRPSAVSIGFFDGVHLGHQTIVRRAIDLAGVRGLRSVVVTFDRHPMEVIRPGSEPPLLMSAGRRARTLAELGVDLVVVLTFNDVLRQLTPAAFIDRVVMRPLVPRRVVVGENFRFGHRAAGDVATLAELGQHRGFAVEGVPLLAIDGEVVSSTRIRQAIEHGDVAGAARLLGRPHVLDGVVEPGDGRGRELGYPTANLEVSARLTVPAHGIYAGLFEHPDGRRLASVTSVGVNPTFGGRVLRVETHLLDVREDLYGLRAAVDFRHRIRAEQRFDNVEELVAEMHRDVEKARRLLGLGSLSDLGRGTGPGSGG